MLTVGPAAQSGDLAETWNLNTTEVSMSGREGFK